MTQRVIPITSMTAGAPQPDWLIPSIGYDAGAGIWRPYKISVSDLLLGGSTAVLQALINASLVGYVHYSKAVVNGGAGTATPVLQAEIAALIAAGGGTLLLGPGTYDCTGTRIDVDLSGVHTRMASRICIQGQGNATTIKNSTGACLFFSGAADNVEGYFQLKDLRLAGNNAGGSIGLQIQKSAYNTIKNVTIESFDLGVDTTDVDQTLFQSCQIQFNNGGVRHNFAAGISDPNTLTYVDTKIGNNVSYGMQASNINQLTFIGGSIQYNGVIGGPAGTYGAKLTDTGSGTGGVVFTGVTFEGNGGEGDFLSAQLSAGVSESNFQFTNCAFQRTLNFITVGYGTNQVAISGTQPKCKYKFANCAFKGLSGYVANAGRPAIANTNANARIEIDAMTQFWSNTEAPADRFTYLGAVGQHTGKMVFCGKTSGESILRGPDISGFDWLLPSANVTLMGRNEAATVSTKTLDNTNTVTLKDTLFTLQDDGDTTKQARFQLSGITTGTLRTYTVPNADTTLAGLGVAQTFTANQVINANLLLGATTTSILANFVDHVGTDKNCYIGGNVNLANGIVIGSIDDTNTAFRGIELRGLTAAFSNASAVVTVPMGVTDTLVTKTSTDVLTNKTLGATTLSGTISGGANQLNNVVIGASNPLAGTFASSSFNPSTSSVENSALRFSGGFGGGIVLVDGTARIVQWSQAFGAEFHLGFGTATGATDAVVFTSTKLTLAGSLGLGSFTVATLPSGSNGMVAYCSNCRMFNGAGTLEGAGAGTGGLVSYNGAWKIAGTNITASA